VLEFPSEGAKPMRILLGKKTISSHYENNVDRSGRENSGRKKSNLRKAILLGRQEAKLHSIEKRKEMKLPFYV